MLKRLKNRLKGEKGFTLVELLAVIVILGIVLAIAIPSVGGVIDKAEQDAHDSNVLLFKNAAKLADLSKEDPADSTSGYTIEELVTGDFLESVPENPVDGDDYADDYVKKESDGWTYNKTVTTP